MSEVWSLDGAVEVKFQWSLKGQGKRESLRKRETVGFVNGASAKGYRAVWVRLRLAEQGNGEDVKEVEP